MKILADGMPQFAYGVVIYFSMAQKLEEYGLTDDEISVFSEEIEETATLILL